MYMIRYRQLFSCKQKHQRRDDNQPSTDTQQAGKYSDNSSYYCVRRKKQGLHLSDYH